MRPIQEIPVFSCALVSFFLGCFRFCIFGMIRNLRNQIRAGYFNSCGEFIHNSNLVIDTCYHVTKAFGGIPLFEPFGNVLDVKCEQPAIFSRFHDDKGGVYYIACVNSPTTTASVMIKYKMGVNIEKCAYGNKFEKIHPHTDPIGKTDGEGGQTINIFLAPGQIALFREV